MMVKTKKPTIHGEMKSRPAMASPRLYFCRRRFVP